MGRGAEVAHDLLVTIGAFFGADESRPRHARRSYDRAATVERSARKESYGENISSASGPKKSQAARPYPVTQPAVPHPRPVLERISEPTKSFS